MNQWPRPISRAQLGKLQGMFRGVDRAARLAAVTEAIGMPCDSLTELSQDQASLAIDMLERKRVAS